MAATRTVLSRDGAMAQHLHLVARRAAVLGVGRLTMAVAAVAAAGHVRLGGTRRSATPITTRSLAAAARARARFASRT